METNKIFLKSWKKLISCHVCTLHVPDFFSLQEYKDSDFEMDSPPFEFEDAVWCFRLYSEKQSKDRFSVEILRLSTEIPLHTLCFKIDALINANKLKYDYYNPCRVIDRSHEHIWLCSFENDCSSHEQCDTLILIANLFPYEAVDEKQTSSKKHFLSNKAVQMKGSKISLELKKKTVSSDFYSLKLPNVFTTSETDFTISSPTFILANATCCFHFRSDKYNTSMCDVSIEVLDSEKPIQYIFIKSILIDSNNKIVDRYCDILRITEISEDVIFYGLDNFESSFYTLHVYIIRKEELEVKEGLTSTVRPRDSHLLCQDLKKLFLDGRNSDLILKVADKEFRVHSSILMARSEVLDAMLSHDMIEKKKGVIEIPDIDVQAMELLLLYIYSGEVGSLKEDNVLGVYYAADKYNMAFLKEECAKFIKQSLSISIICDAIQFALNHDDKDLLECCTEYFVNHVGDILPTVEWMSFMKSNSIVANELYIKANKKCSCDKSQALKK